MPVTSLAELREALRAAKPGNVVELAPGEYRGPVVIDTPLTLRGLDRKTVLWRRGGPVIYIRTPGVTLERILIERTVETRGPLIVHNVGCAPTGRESMQLDTLISLGDLVPGSTLILPLEIDTIAHAELAVTGLYGAQITPTILEGRGSHLAWLTVDGKAIARGEVVLGEIALREGDKTRYLWLSGSVLDAPPTAGTYCLALKKTRIYPSASGLMLDGKHLAALDGGQAAPGRYAFVQRDPSGVLFLHVPGKPPAPVQHNGTALAPLSRVLLQPNDTVKIGGLSMTVQNAEPPGFTLEPEVITFAEFDERFPDAVSLTLGDSRTPWKGRAISTTPWLDVLPAGDFRIPAGRSHTWTVQLNGEALTLPNGPHESISGLLVSGTNAVIGVDVRLNVRRPDVFLQVAPLDAGSVEFGWPAERQFSVSIGNLGRGAWEGTIRSNVPWLQVTSPMPVRCEPWSEIGVDLGFAAAWDALPVGVHEVSDALILNGPAGEQHLAAKIEVFPARGHLAATEPVVNFDAVERNAPLPNAVFQVRNDGGGTWTGSVRSSTEWTRLKPDTITLEPGATAEIEVSLLDVPAELALNTTVLIDDIEFTGAEAEEAELTVGVHMAIVELPPYLVASPVYFPPFVKGDNLPEGLLRIYNNGPARWRGAIAANVPWINVPDTTFSCEPGYPVEVYVALNSKALDVLQPGLSRWDDVLSVTGGREPVTASVQIDMRKEITEIYLDTPTLNFGQVDGAAAELPSQVVRLVNASPAAWKGSVALCVPWLSVQSASRTFDLDVPGQSIAEFSVSLNDLARRAAPGIVAEDQAVRITAQAQVMTIRALYVLNEWSARLSLSPEKVRLDGELAQPVTIRNTGSRECTLQVNAAPWLNVTSAQLTLGPGQEQVLEIKRKPVTLEQPAPPALSDPRAVVLIGPGREFEIEIEIVEPSK